MGIRERMEERELTPFEQGVEVGILLATSPPGTEFTIDDLAKRVGKRYAAMYLALARCRLAYVRRVEVGRRVLFRFARPEEE